MNFRNTTYNKTYIFIMLCIFFAGQQAMNGQQESSNLSSSSTYHNQIFFNRFLINPTFSLVRENKSYLNILHRNQYATFEDNTQNYFLGFSNKLNEHTALGIGVYSQWSGVVQEFGFNANYATSVNLGEKSKLTFGTNLSYFNEGVDKSRVIASTGDTEILDSRKESKLAIQPAVTLSVGRFDFGLYATDLLKYNQSTNEFLTSFNDKSIKASLQYTHDFVNSRGLFEDARLMPLVQLGRNQDNSLAYLGSVVLDLPKYGWIQTSFDDDFGLSMGLGFNINKTMSVGYLMEKDVLEENADFGWNHEVSLAYKFKDKNDDTIYADASVDKKIDGIIKNYEEQIAHLTAQNKKNAEQQTKKKAKLNKRKELAANSANRDDLAYQNRLILDELMLRQDSIEAARTQAFEKKFSTIVRVLRNDVKYNIKAYMQGVNENQNTVLVSNTKQDVKSSNAQGKTEKHRDYKLPIKVLNSDNIVGVKKGYYVIANVYKNKKYLGAFMNTLKEQGLNAKQFYNKENGLYYVYLADFDIKKDAESAFVTNLGGKYNDEKWIMQVDNTSATAVNMFED